MGSANATDADRARLRRHGRGNAAGLRRGSAQDRRGVEPVITALKDENSYVRATAAWALGEIKDLRAVEPLIAALKEKSHGVRKNAALALKTITGKDFGKDAALWQKWWDKNKNK